MMDKDLSIGIMEKVFKITQAVYRVTALFDTVDLLAQYIRNEASEVLRDFARYSMEPAVFVNEFVLIKGKIKAVRNLLQLARSGRLAHAINFEVLDREYNELELFCAGIIERDNIKKMPASSDDMDKSFIENDRFNDNYATRKLNIPQDFAEYSGKKTGFSLNLAKKQITVQPDSGTGSFSGNNMIAKNEINNDNKNFYGSYRQKIITDILKDSNLGIKDIALSFNNVSSKTIQRDLNNLIRHNLVKRSGDKRWAVYSLSR